MVMTNQRQDGYPTATPLAYDLARFRAGAPVSVRSVNVLERLTRALHQSHSEIQFAAWGRVVLFWAAVVFATQIGSAILIASRPESLDNWLMVSKAIQFSMIALSIVHGLRRGLFPAGPAERMLWTVWAGYAVACITLSAASRIMGIPERPHDPLLLYPQYAIVSGLAFTILGATVWGGSYVIGAIFFGLALAMPFAIH